MAKSEKIKPSEPENIDTTLDTVLITALQENFEVKNGCHIDRNEILEFLRSVIREHPELNFVLQHRDTKLSSRIYKAFPKVTTKRVAVPNIRGKKTWTYTNLRRITGGKDSQTKQDTKSSKTPETRTAKNEETKTEETESSSLIVSPKRERRQVKSKRNISASMVHRNSFFETYKQESSKKRNRIVGNVPHHSYLGRFNDMINWVKENYILDKNSSIQVKHIVECIKTEFKINITYKQSHKLIFAVFPGTTSRVEHPVKIEAHGGYYSYKGVAPMPKRGLEDETPVTPEMSTSPTKSTEAQSAITRSVDTKQANVHPGSQSSSELEDAGRKRIFRTRKRFIEACAVLKPAEEALISPDSYDALPRNSDLLHKAHGMIPRVSDVSPTVSEAATRFAEVSPKLSDLTPRFSEFSPRLADVSRRFSKVTPKFYELPPLISDDLQRCESNWQRLYEELKQERDQAIVERNQAMVSLMEIEREQASRTPDDLPRCQAALSEVVPSITRAAAKSEDRRSENPDWLRSLISRSNSILGEQMSEANAVYFPGSTLQRSNCSPGFLKQTANSGDYLDLERYEQLKQERDAIWKNCMEKLRTEKDDIIQQLKLEKVEVIQRMEMDKSDAVESVEEKLTNQVTILTREMRELKELLNHTMNERALAIDHSHKLMELVGKEKLKESGLDHLPFDATSNHVVHPPKLNSPDETVGQKTLTSFAKGNKRKQSMPAKLKKIPRLEASVGTENTEKQDPDISNQSQTVSTNSENLITDLESSLLGRDTMATDIGVADTIDNIAADIQTTDSGPTDNRAIGDESDSNNFAHDNDASDYSISPITDLTNCKTSKDTVCTPPQKCSSNPPAGNSTSPEIVSADENTNLNSTVKALDAESILHSGFPGKEDSNMDISEKSDKIIASSVSEKSDDLTTTNVEATSPKHPFGNSNVISNSNQDIEISTSENCQISAECETAENLGAPQKLPSVTNSENKFAASPTNSWNIDSAKGSPQSTGSFPGKSGASLASNTHTYYSDASGNSEKCLHEFQQPLNFPKYLTEIPRNAPNTEVQKVNPLSVANSAEYIRRESTKSFEESINSTFLKYFPKMPKSSFNSPLTGDSGKYFRDIPRTVRSPVDSDSRKYIKDHESEALVFSDKVGISEQRKVSSIDFLNSMVENIGKPSV